MARILAEGQEKARRIYLRRELQGILTWWFARSDLWFKKNVSVL